MNAHIQGLNSNERVPVADAGKPAVSAPAAEATVIAPAAAKRRGPMRKILLSATALVIIAGTVYYGEQYWTTGRFEISTDDAYVQADNSAIAPKISGYISAVLVGDNELVKAGQVLARIDDRDFATALDQARADVEAARAAIDAKQAALDTQQTLIDADRATIDVDHANETFAEQNDKRYSNLATNGYAAVQTAQQAAAQILATRAATARDSASLSGAIKQVDLLKAELAGAKAALAHDAALQHQAELNMSYANVMAPLDGMVGNRTLRVGQYVQAGTQLMTVVPTAAAYVIANYKETQLTDVHAGQSVEIDVDMFPGRTYHGHVDSLAPASGQEFALLPPDNATGNFTKVVQRIPVKIVLDADSVSSGDLRPGMSVTPTIDTKISTDAKRPGA